MRSNTKEIGDRVKFFDFQSFLSESASSVESRELYQIALDKFLIVLEKIPVDDSVENRGNFLHDLLVWSPSLKKKYLVCSEDCFLVDKKGSRVYEKGYERKVY